MSASVPDAFAELRAAAIRFRDERDWEQYHNAKDLALGLSIEAAELCELFLWMPSKDAETALQDASFRQRFAEELADIQIYLLYLAHAANLDIASCVHRKLEINAVKYPIEKAKGRSTKYTDL